MSKTSRVRRQQLLRQAEGYLELILACESRWSLEAPLRDKTAQLCLECLTECEPEESEHGHLLYLRGEALRLQERFVQAIAPLTQAAEVDGENIHTYLALGWCYKRTQQLDMAIEALERGLEIDFGLAILHYNLACYWSLANRPKMAISYLATAFEIDGSYRDLVADESDFDPIRNHPDFHALTSVIV